MWRYLEISSGSKGALFGKVLRLHFSPRVIQLGVEHDGSTFKVERQAHRRRIIAVGVLAVVMPQVDDEPAAERRINVLSR